MFCINCGTEIQEGAKFCSNCGINIEQHLDTHNERSPKYDMPNLNREIENNLAQDLMPFSDFITYNKKTGSLAKKIKIILHMLRMKIRKILAITVVILLTLVLGIILFEYTELLDPFKSSETLCIQANEYESKRNHKLAFKYYKKSAERGYAMAQNSLGVCYAIGQGVQKDYEEALKWYKKAASQGEGAAMMNIADCYKQGQGVQKV